jgi:hypothetical protein
MTLQVIDFRWCCFNFTPSQGRNIYFVNDRKLRSNTNMERFLTALYLQSCTKLGQILTVMLIFVTESERRTDRQMWMTNYVLRNPNAE